MPNLGKKFGFVGGGQMAEAIIKGIINAGLCSAEDILVTDVSDARLGYMSEKYKVRVENTLQGKVEAIKISLNRAI
jgi:pyrroline-5-carboxylate reductase